MGKSPQKLLLALDVRLKPRDIRLQFVRHGVKVPAQLSDFVRGPKLGPGGQVSAGNLPHRRRQRPEPPGQGVGENHRNDHACQHHNHIDLNIAALLGRADPVDGAQVKPGRQNQFLVPGGNGASHQNSVAIPVVHPKVGALAVSRGGKGVAVHQLGTALVDGPGLGGQCHGLPAARLLVLHLFQRSP